MKWEIPKEDNVALVSSKNEETNISRCNFKV